MKSFIKLSLFLTIVLTLSLIISCSDKSTEPEHEAEVTLTISPNPATVNTEITLTFEVEEDGEHTAVTMFSCEIEKVGVVGHTGMTLMADMGEIGHYSGNYTFTETGSYEAHFEFMHDEEMHERHFDIVVQ